MGSPVRVSGDEAGTTCRAYLDINYFLIFMVADYFEVEIHMNTPSSAGRAHFGPLPGLISDPHPNFRPPLQFPNRDTWWRYGSGPPPEKLTSFNVKTRWRGQHKACPLREKLVKKASLRAAVRAYALWSLRLNPPHHPTPLASQAKQRESACGGTFLPPVAEYFFRLRRNFFFWKI